jgi:predicted Fe-Mo cluster-binding NifX family protein
MADPRTGRLRVAVAAGDEIDAVEHFGRAARFLVYDVEDGLVSFRDSRLTVAACGGGEGWHDTRIEAVVDVIADCDIVLVHEVGPGAVRILQRRDVTPIQMGGFVDDAVSKFAAAYGRTARPKVPGVTQ